MVEDANRRPLSSRDTGWAAALMRFLARTSITPNQISMASMVMAAVSGGAFWQAGTAEGGIRILLLLCGAIFCQLRLLCNLLDGMVAIEAGKKAPDGAFWNEFPDRVADILILVGVGYCISLPALGWAAAVFAVLTAYVRELGRASDAPPDFSGPMAKPHRMAAITAGALLSLIEPLWNGHNQVLSFTLWFVVIGTVLTTLRRSSRLIRHLRNKRTVG